MSIILQGFLQIDIAAYFLPFVTMALTVSFALTPLVGNLFLATCFVFFMIPYEIGNKIVIGVTSDKVIGYVRAVSLLYTTVKTPSNEIVSIN